MRITFAGVGEAFDETLPNTSLLLESDTTSLLLDCGFTAASAFWQAARTPQDLDAISISHFHGDHWFGVPALLMRFVDEGRTRPLHIIGQPGVEHHVRQLTDLAYPNVLSKAAFEIRFHILLGCQEAKVGDMTISSAPADHPMPSLAMRVDCAGKSVFYSGDGRPTEETRTLATGCHLVVHESFSLEADKPGHGTVDSSIRFAVEAGAATLALVHIQRHARRNGLAAIKEMAAREDRVRILVPAPGEWLDV